MLHLTCILQIMNIWVKNCPQRCEFSLSTQRVKIISERAFFIFVPQDSRYCKVRYTSPARLEAHTGFFRLSMKGKFDVYLL